MSKVTYLVDGCFSSSVDKTLETFVLYLQFKCRLCITDKHITYNLLGELEGTVYAV